MTKEEIFRNFIRSYHLTAKWDKFIELNPFEENQLKKSLKEYKDEVASKTPFTNSYQFNFIDFDSLKAECIVTQNFDMIVTKMEEAAELYLQSNTSELKREIEELKKVVYLQSKNSELAKKNQSEMIKIINQLCEFTPYSLKSQVLELTKKVSANLQELKEPKQLKEN